MAYSREIYDAAMAELEKRRIRAVTMAGTLRETMIVRHPRLRDIELEMANSSIEVAKAVLAGVSVTETVEKIKNHNLSLQAEMATILHNDGVAAGNFEPVYNCPACDDTGYAGGKICECLKNLLQEEACRRLSSMTAMKLTTFDEMDIGYYPDTQDPVTGIPVRRRMQDVLQYCRQYAEDFSLESPSLLLRGTTGTGKTHVSLAIARRAAEQGFSVVYGPVQVLLHRLEKEHFGREEGNSEDMMTSCDLLILDDVGSEFTSSFYTSCLYHLINTRMLGELPTIISTNLNQVQLKERYGDQITSRITGGFIPLMFMGRDIRQLKAQQRG